jgi:hypothetical protein
MKKKKKKKEEEEEEEEERKSKVEGMSWSQVACELIQRPSVSSLLSPILKIPWNF